MRSPRPLSYRNRSIVRMATRTEGVTQADVCERFPEIKSTNAGSLLAYLVRIGRLTKVREPGQKTRFFAVKEKME